MARAIAWHPDRNILAIALADHSIAVYDMYRVSKLNGSNDGKRIFGCKMEDVNPIVINMASLKNVISMSWSLVEQFPLKH